MQRGLARMDGSLRHAADRPAVVVEEDDEFHVLGHDGPVSGLVSGPVCADMASRDVVTRAPALVVLFTSCRAGHIVPCDARNRGD